MRRDTVQASRPAELTASRATTSTGSRPPTKSRIRSPSKAPPSTGEFVAGAFVADERGCSFDADAYLRAADAIAERGGVPVMFPSHGLNALADDDWLLAHQRFGSHLDRFLAARFFGGSLPHGESWVAAISQRDLAARFVRHEP